jgi:hypothetical protein
LFQFNCALLQAVILRTGFTKNRTSPHPELAEELSLSKDPLFLPAT